MNHQLNILITTKKLSIMNNATNNNENKTVAPCTFFQMSPQIETVETNLFDFDYRTTQLKNEDQTDSKFSVCYGQGGNVMHCKKDSYTLVKTSDLSRIGQAFKDQGKDVKTFVHRNGETIGLNVLLGTKQTKIGDKTYNALITVPNNGGGRGFLSIKETRLICTNGMVKTIENHKSSYIKIPHTFNYNSALELMKKAVLQFELIIEQIECKDLELDNHILDKHEAQFMLNEWFFNNEMPDSHKKEMTFNDFRKLLATDPKEIKSLARYEELLKAFRLEQQYNKELDLSLSKYTVFAAVTNYISRRIEKSSSTASDEIAFSRQAAKLEYFN